MATRSPEAAEKKRAYMREYNRRPERRALSNAASRKYAASEKGKARSRAYKRKYARKGMGILNPTDETRAGVCPVCLREGRLAMDHDHATGFVRGWLCGNRNRGAGLLGDTLAAAQRLVSYLAVPV
jgi:hypothetical protein